MTTFMKFRAPIFFSVLIVGLLLAAFLPKSVDQDQKEAILMRSILMALNQYHYQPQEINDDFSRKVFDLYLTRLDYYKRLVTGEEISRLKQYELQLDDQSLNGSFEFFDLSLEIYRNGLERAKGYAQEILASPFDFGQNEMINLDYESLDYPKDEAALKAYWSKYLKYRTLTKVTERMEAAKKNTVDQPESMEVLEAKAREEELEFFEEYFSRMLKVKRLDILSTYFNAMTNVYDPHSTYFLPKDKEEFDMSFSGRYEGIGARLMNEGDFTKITEVIVGGPAWRGGELEADDLILKVTQENGDATDITGMLSDEVVTYIKGPKGTKVILTVKKVDGSVEDIEIIRDVVVLEEKYAKSLVIQDSVDGQKIGYLFLPSFYADFDDANGRFSAADVAAEVEKLKAEAVDGIVLDLRFNGGGSLEEVVKMAGFFIETGPIVQAKSRGRDSRIFKDDNPHMIYDGPLAIMVDNYSASASEILAAAMQDYQRAVIVGSKSTYGKGSVQFFLDLDRLYRDNVDFKPLGNLKITFQKYYRINGGSVQLKGVVPDIILPNNYQFLEMGEKDFDYALDWTEINPLPFEQMDQFTTDHFAALAAKSKARVDNNPAFQSILENAARIKDQKDEREIPLNLSVYNDWLAKREEESKMFRELTDQVVLPKVENPKVDLPAINGDEAKKARNAEWIKSVEKDIYVQETVNILKDMMRPKQ
jgi:carboxyl-terminal processing protease